MEHFISEQLQYLNNQIEQLDFEYCGSQRFDKSKDQMFVYVTANSMREYASELLQNACRLVEDDIITGDEHSRCVYWYHKIYQKKCEVIRILHANGFLEPGQDIADTTEDILMLKSANK